MILLWYALMATNYVLLLEFRSHIWILSIRKNLVWDCCGSKWLMTPGSVIVSFFHHSGRKLSLEGRGSCMRMERSDKANPHKYKRNVIGWCLYSQCESSEKSTSFRKMNITWQKARVKVAYSCQKQELEKNILMCELIARKEMRPVYKGH